MEKKRLIHFEGTFNFRDMGGLRTQDGHRMKMEILYRSDELSQLSVKILKNQILQTT